MPWEALIKAVVAGLVASAACGLGALPLLIKSIDVKRHAGAGYSFAGGLMMAASVYNLILPSLRDMGQSSGHLGLAEVLPVIVGILVGAGFLDLTNRFLSEDRIKRFGFKMFTGRTEILIFVAMLIHSIPEGVAVGVGYQAEASDQYAVGALGTYIALAIAVHNIPEGLAVALPLRAGGASIAKCYWAGFLTSLPQPIAAIPAVLLAWLFAPMMPFLMGFAAGAMMYLIVVELIPDALSTDSRTRTAAAFITGFCLMILVQVLL